ncbi:unnamed protein product [Symbiodinium natans]|uniref:Uncharacterized protein n=1 Tax=Symbiodinium natans TaxID=878477 RepID=A0A812TIN6_9DINO|nr:unnamed protein product [Symbiodinium natans]
MVVTACAIGGGPLADTARKLFAQGCPELIDTHRHSAFEADPSQFHKVFNEKIHDVLQHYTYDSSQVDSWKTDIVAACGDAVQGSGWRFQFECAIIPAAEELPAWSVPEAPEFDKEEDMLLVLENPSDTYKVRLTAIGKPEAPGAPPVQPSQPQQPPRPVQAGEEPGKLRHGDEEQAEEFKAAISFEAHAAAFEPATGPVTTAEARTEQPAATASSEELQPAYVEDEHQIAPFEDEPLESEEEAPSIAATTAAALQLDKESAASDVRVPNNVPEVARSTEQPDQVQEARIETPPQESAASDVHVLNNVPEAAPPASPEAIPTHREVADSSPTRPESSSHRDADPSQFYMVFNEKIQDVLQHYTYDSSHVDSWKTDIVAACGDAVQGTGWWFQFECVIIPAAEELRAWSVPEAPEFDKEEDMLLVLENPSDTYKVRLTAIGKPEAPGAPPVQPSQPQQPPRPVQDEEVTRPAVQPEQVEEARIETAPEESAASDVHVSNNVPEAARPAEQPDEVEQAAVETPPQDLDVPEGSDEEYADDIEDEDEVDEDAEEVVPTGVSEQGKAGPVPPTDEDESPLSHRSTKRYVPRRLPLPKPPTEEEAFSEAALRKRAEQKLKQSMQLTAMNIPSVTNYPKPFAGRIELTLDTLSAEAQRSFLRVARFEAETWLRQQQQSCETQVRIARRQARLLDQLAEWRDRKDKEEQEERKRLEELEREHEEREQKDRERWRKRGEELRQCLAGWAAEKNQQEQEKTQAAERAQKEEEEKRRQKEARYREKQRERLQEWQRQKMEKLEEQRLAEEQEEEKEAAEAARKQSAVRRGRRRKAMKRLKEGPKRRPMPKDGAVSNDPTVIEDAGSDAKSSA